jgi:hypothetical protein
MAEEVVAEVRMYVSRAPGEDGGYRTSVFAGPVVGPEDHRLLRDEFVGSSLDESVDPALAWVGRAIRSTQG